MTPTGAPRRPCPTSSDPAVAEAPAHAPRSEPAEGWWRRIRLARSRRFRTFWLTTCDLLSGDRFSDWSRLRAPYVAHSSAAQTLTGGSDVARPARYSSRRRDPTR
jgi:hypothetical protein